MSALGLINTMGPCPPDGYRWKCPKDGWESHAWDYRTWVEQAEKHFQVNPGHPVFSGEQMQEQLCATLPPGWCNYADPNRPRPSVTMMDWNDVLRGTQALSGWLLKGTPVVEQKEAERRAEICSRCYLNVRMSGCSTCQAAVQKLASTVQSRFDQYIDSCAVCKCNLRLKVHFPQELLDKENPGVQELYPDHCWLRKGGSNYVEPHLSGGGSHSVRTGNL